MYTYNYNALKGKIIEKFGNIGNFADASGTSRQVLSYKLMNKRAFKQNEITKYCALLDIPPSGIGHYFFTINVEKTKQGD